METITLHAPAKINLTLDVTGKRPDGYHTLVSVMQAVDVCDRITLSRRNEPGIALTLSDPRLPTDGRNTAYRAAEVFFRETGTAWGVEIHIAKYIPQQAGMAGGSADAAGVLWGLNRLAGNPCSVDKLCRMGAAVGADVPFCVKGGCALAEGIGERLTPLPSLPDCTIVVIKPPVGVSTGEAYRLVDETALETRQDQAEMLRALQNQDLSGVGQALGNVFERAIRLPEVTAIRTAMAAFRPQGSMMTGSGSAVFGLFDDDTTAIACAAALADQGEVYLCRPCPSGPWEDTDKTQAC